MVSPTYVEGVIPCTRFAGLILHFARGDFCHFADFELEILRETSKYFVTSMSPFLLLEVCRRVSFWGSPFSFGVGGSASSSCKLTVKGFEQIQHRIFHIFVSIKVAFVCQVFNRWSRFCVR